MKRSLPSNERADLRALVDEDSYQMVMVPRSKMPYDVAATAWTQMMTCDKYEGAATLDAIRDFRDTYIGLGPEPLPLSVPE